LDEHGIVYTSLHHDETPTSEDSARVRGVDLSTGGKALMLKIGDNDTGTFGLFVMSASRKLNSKAVKKEFRATKGVRFATRDELAEKTGGLVPGAVPPFGRPILLDLDLYVDTSITENERIAFNAGSLTESVIMDVQDYLKVASPQKIFSFSK
jgi:prolyl-tRNA editing enzyme YbaK/EbsC (Cys-tRNA(Pro) deacylase)